MSFLPPLSAFSVFLGIAAVGFLFLLISLVFGEVFDHLGGGFDSGLDHGGPGFFSGRVMAVFITAFGGFGAIGTYYGLGPIPASGVGFASGLVFGGAIYLFAKFLYGQQASSDVGSHDLVGQIARVVVAIPAGGVGQIRCRLGEELVDKIARTRNGDAIGENASVQVEEVLGETVIVKKH
jgi:membrane protein implicated in regulation of membrane protease activity